MKRFEKIKGFENYLISDEGEVINFKKNKEVKTFIVSGGYVQAGLYLNGKRKFVYVHCLVAEAFVPNTEGKPEVNHKNEVKTDNRVENLEWVTHVENINKGTHNERMIKALSIPVIQYDKEGKELKQWDSMADAGRSGFHVGTISRCCRGIHKTHKGFIWKFKNTIR